VEELSLAGGKAHVAADRAELARAAAEAVASAARTAVAARGRFALALSGGSTPRDLYRLLAADPLTAAMPWPAVHLYWGDERCVPPDHVESNFRMVREALLDKVPIPAGNVHRIPAEDPDSERAAERYEAELRASFGLGPLELPRFDLVLLGLGLDGHTASLFPGTGAVAVSDRLCFALRVEKLATHRITLSLPVLNAARGVAFLAAGADKAEPLRALAAGARSADELPAGAVRPRDGELAFWLDREAASLLPR